jgi:hypothetical protein
MRPIPVLAVLVFTMFAQDKPAPDPISDRMRYELAAAQRDYVIAKQQFDTATLRLKEKLEQAEKTCSAQSATFDLAQFVCAPNLTAKKP